MLRADSHGGGTPLTRKPDPALRFAGAALFVSAIAIALVAGVVVQRRGSGPEVTAVAPRASITPFTTAVAVTPVASAGPSVALRDLLAGGPRHPLPAGWSAAAPEPWEDGWRVAFTGPPGSGARGQQALRPYRSVEEARRAVSDARAELQSAGWSVQDAPFEQTDDGVFAMHVTGDTTEWQEIVRRGTVAGAMTLSFPSVVTDRDPFVRFLAGMPTALTTLPR